MNKELEKLVQKSILSVDEISFSHLESVLAKKFNISAEQLQKVLIESETSEEFFDKLGINKEVL